MFAGLPADSTRNDTYSLYYYRDRIELCQDTVLESMAKKDEVPLLDSTVNMPVDLASTFHRKSTFVALKTNLLYDAVTALNVELEVPIGKRFSVMVEDVFPWWSFGPNGNKYCLQLWSMGIEPRWWFYRKGMNDKLQGHFVAPYVMSGKYDLQWDTSICYRGYGWSAGLTYGYSMPLCKWLNMEFSMSIGYLNASFQHYQPSPDYEHLYKDPAKAGRMTYVGPTKVKVSLVVPIRFSWRTRK